MQDGYGTAVEGNMDTDFGMTSDADAALRRNLWMGTHPTKGRRRTLTKVRVTNRKLASR